MESNVYLSKDFFDYLFNNKSIQDNSVGIETSTEKLNYQKITQIITKSHLQLSYTIKEILDIIQEKKDPIKSAWLNTIIKTPYNKSYDANIDYSKPNSIFFEGDVDCMQISSKRNVLCKGTNYNFKGEFFKSPLRSEFDIRMNTKDVSNSFHECKNIILIDPYIFANEFKKKNSLINFLTTCFNYKNRSAEKNLTIISEFPTNTGHPDFVKNKIVNQYLLILSESLNIPKNNITILRHVGSEFQGNRHVITDYALMDLQHVFDRDNGVVSGLYFYNNEIDKNFVKANTYIKKIKDLNEKSNEKYDEAHDEKLKQNNLKFGNILNNPLFN
ncbi:hypothetical protein [Lacinutrix himadriensis]|uniref:hypothetical protein n=1 Tax=Lacinutrix himadriensis TaxID=641549 RepID=UPI0006E1F669|nr:hypothetical protein [Lacinutrix himadriensis]